MRDILYFKENLKVKCERIF